MSTRREGSRARTMRGGWPLLATLAVLLVASQPVLGTAYSIWAYRLSMDPAGAEPDTDYCVRAGIIDTVINQTGIKAFENSGDDCDGPLNNLPATWLGSNAYGYRDGSLCGTTGYWYSNVVAASWQVLDNLCTNPAGPQEFRTKSFGRAWDGDSYRTLDPVFSPFQNY